MYAICKKEIPLFLYRILRFRIQLKLIFNIFSELLVEDEKLKIRAKEARENKDGKESKIAPTDETKGLSLSSMTVNSISLTGATGKVKRTREQNPCYDSDFSDSTVDENEGKNESNENDDKGKNDLLKDLGF